MAEHVHGCLTCRPEMVPDFSRDDPRYHSYATEKCRSAFRVLVNGADAALTRGVFEGREGWALIAGNTTADVHDCPRGSWSPCIEPRFGTVTVIHEGAC